MSEEFPIRPIHVPIAVAAKIVGESRATLYAAIKRGELTAAQAGARTVLFYDELEARCAARPLGLRPVTDNLRTEKQRAARQPRRKPKSRSKIRLQRGEHL